MKVVTRVKKWDKKKVGFYGAKCFFSAEIRDKLQFNRKNRGGAEGAENMLRKPRRRGGRGE